MPSRGVFSLESAQLILPPEVTLDTSYVVNALVKDEPHHEPARAFLERLAEARSALVFNELLELELRETAFKIPLVERFPADWKKRRHDGRSLRRARRLVQETVDAWEDLLSAFTYLEVQVGETIGRVEDLMGGFGLSSYDAIHVATAEYAGAPTLITTDAGFASVPQSRLTIYTNASRVGPCRRMRRRRQFQRADEPFRWAHRLVIMKHGAGLLAALAVAVACTEGPAKLGSTERMAAQEELAIPEGKLLLQYWGNGAVVSDQSGVSVGLDANVLYDLSQDGSMALGGRSIREPSGITRDVELVLFDASTGAGSVIRQAGPREDVSLATWSPDGAAIAYRLSVYGTDPSKAHPGDPLRQSVCVIDLRAGEDRCFASFESVLHFGWSPQGSLVVEGDGPYRVLELDAGTGETRVILGQEGTASIRAALRLAGLGRPSQFAAPVWSRSGRYIAAYASIRGGDAGVVPMVFEPDGRFVAMGSASTESVLIGWSPVKDLLAFTTSRPPSRTTGLFVLDPSTGQSERLLRFEKRTQVSDLIWSSSGRWVAIARFDWAGSGDFGIMLVHPDGVGEPQELPVGHSMATEPLVDWVP